jgi:glycosyltransferase involved in cell wall biosynthesis
MALRTPVVATTKGAEGLDVHHGQQILLADTPENFAQAVVRVLQDAGLRQHLADEAHAVARTQYDGKVVLPHFLDIVERVAAIPSGL